MLNVIRPVIASLTVVLAGCATTTEYDRKRAEAAEALPAYEKAYADMDCYNLRFRFENQMAFDKTASLASLKCIEVERDRNALRSWVNGTIEEDELTAGKAYDSYRAIFTYYSTGEISLPRAQELYRYAREKNRIEAQAEINRSNQLAAQGFENQRRAWEQENLNRAIFLQSLVRPQVYRAPVVTTCDRNVVTNTVTCTTQ